jgi:hypothetical protein
VDHDAARALLAGFIAGAAVAFATTAIALVTVSRNTALQARLGEARRLPLLGVVLANALFLGWTLLGLVLGAAFIGVEDRYPDGGPATGNWLFSLLVLGLTLVALLGTGFVLRRLTLPLAGTALVAALAFGVLLPSLAG